jgi:8-oxo-dGTP pyrophosphatase MutT (NUDIX family)
MAYVPKACGFVLARDGEEGWRYLLLTSTKWDEAGFPKGHVDAGESEIETARRETDEETGLGGLEPLPGFRVDIAYPVERKGRRHEKHAVYFLAKTAGTGIRLSSEHSEAGWYGLAEARARLTHDSARTVLREAALHLKDPALFDLELRTQPGADAFLASLPEAVDGLLAHLRGAARLARRFADSLARARRPCHVEAAAVGTLLHDTGRALGRHADHQRAGLRYLRGTPFSPYAFACISHSTKGATHADLVAAGLPEAEVDEYFALIDGTTFTWEEHCAALADSCMRLDEAVHPDLRFADLRERYGPSPLIDLQERRTTQIREALEAATGEDPLALVDLA